LLTVIQNGQQLSYVKRYTSNFLCKKMDNEIKNVQQN